MKIKVFELKCMVNAVLNINPNLKFTGGFLVEKKIVEDYNSHITVHSTPETLDSQEVSLNLGLKWASTKFDVSNDTFEDGLKVIIEHIRNNSMKFYHFLEWPPLTILPAQDKCCDSQLTLSSGRNAKLFTRQQTYNCKTFEATCAKCGSQYGHGYKEVSVGDKKRRYYLLGRFFLLMKGSVFDDVFLREITKFVVLSRTKFNQIADIYNSSQSKEKSLDPDILSNTYIVWNVVRRLKGFGLLMKHVSPTNRHKDVEALCTEVIPDVLETFRVWIYHKCNEIGCKARLAIVDGNEVNKRKICAVPGDKILPSDKSRFNVYKKCIKNPLRGVGSIYCEDHNKDGTPKAAETEEQQDLRPETRRWVKEMEERQLLPKVDDMNEIADPDGCRKPENINKVTETARGLTTAGILLWTRSCLTRLHMCEIYHAESLTQWATSMIDTFTEDPDPEVIKYVCGDRVCEFCPFCEKRAEKGNEVLRKYMDVLEGFPLDKFHGDRHVKPQCQPSGEAAKYNARLPRFRHLDGTNYEAAEQSFRKINESSGTTCYMTYAKRLCLMTFINDEYNVWREEQLEVLISGRDKQDWRKEDDIVKRKSREWKKVLVGLLE